MMLNDMSTRIDMLFALKNRKHPVTTEFKRIQVPIKQYQHLGKVVVLIQRVTYNIATAH